MIKLAKFPNQYYLGPEDKLILVERLKEIIEQIENDEICNIFCATSGPSSYEHSILHLSNKTTLALASAEATKIYNER